MAEAKTAPRFLDIFDWRLRACLVLLALIGLMAWDQLNVSLNRALAPAGDPAPNPAVWKVGSTHSIGISLVTSDRDRLSCGDDRVFEGNRCEFDANKKRVVVEGGSITSNNRKAVLQPYRTALGNHLVFIAGVWNTHAVAFRHHQEPPRGKTDKQLKRFATTCQLRFLGVMDDVFVRWGPSGKWYKEKTAPVAVAESCVIPPREK